ncbi:MAG: hypothetical protein WA154_09555 [Moraxellaceae bacterium]
MLNRDQLQELGRFKLLMRRACQETVHIEQFLTDRNYQSQMLDMAEDQDDDELLLMLAVTLRGRLGRLGEGEEAFEQICPKTVLAQSEPDQPAEVVEAAVEMPASVAAMLRTESEPEAEPVAAERVAVRTRSVLSSLFATSANRMAANNSVAVDATPRYIHSLR